MRDIKYVIYKEGNDYVSQCLNVDISSFGHTVDEALENLVEALELYFEEDNNDNYIPIELAMIGERTINA